MKVFLFCVALSTLAGCALPEVKAWERGHLAKQEMAWEPDVMGANLRRHIYSAKEGATGDISASGGGCGCY